MPTGAVEVVKDHFNSTLPYHKRSFAVKSMDGILLSRYFFIHCHTFAHYKLRLLCLRKASECVYAVRRGIMLSMHMVCTVGAKTKNVE